MHWIHQTYWTEKQSVARQYEKVPGCSPSVMCTPWCPASSPALNVIPQENVKTQWLKCRLCIILKSNHHKSGVTIFSHVVGISAKHREDVCIDPSLSHHQKSPRSRPCRLLKKRAKLVHTLWPNSKPFAVVFSMARILSDFSQAKMLLFRIF